MKNLKLVFALFVFSLAIVSCKNEQEAELEKLKSELLAKHDEVMPKSMGLLELKNKIDSIAKGKINQKNLLAVADSLKSADAAMMAWMTNLGVALNDTQDKTKQLEMYKKLNAEIDLIKKRTEQSILNAKSQIK